ncbi:acetyl-CoA carboxylase biotin carboxylase subunit [soil metagenome]
MTISRILVANRSEIAVRVIRAARDLGLETVAVHSEADADAAHVALADEAVEIGPAQASRSYLDIDRLIDAATGTGANAIHPGYGFLSENAAFAQRCEDEDLTFVGPSAATIREMGDKVEARRIAADAGVPTVPGSDGAVDHDAARVVADEVGYPLLVKAAGGGGGRGIKVVDSTDALDDALTSARREAESAFGSGAVYLERFLPSARHIEVQVLGDGEHAVHLFDRECSLQRNRQKVVEEGPSPALGDARRGAITASAVRLAEAIGYRSAGTVEYLVDPDSGEFFFIELNTRIQVEHPATEMITGIDLVAAQLRIAGGEPLWLAQDDITRRGCAIECRINAEDPANDFFPSPGVIEQLTWPAGPWVRVDTALAAGDEVPPYYDSLIAKLIVLGGDRDQALARCRRALDELTIAPIQTTAPMLRALLDDDDVRAGDYSTTFLEQWVEDWKER